MRVRQILPVTRQAKILLYAVLLGVFIGYIALAYRWCVSTMTTIFNTSFDVLPPEWRMLMPVAGSVLMLIFLFAIRAEIREYVPEVIESSVRSTPLRLKDGVSCFITSIITLSSGGSAGPEGPLAFTGAAAGSWSGNRLKLNSRHAKILLAAGAAAGIAAIFNAPLAGVLFALEIILFNDLTMSAVTPVILSSVAASAVTFQFLGDQPTFRIPIFSMNSYLELFAYALLGLAGGFVSALFCRVMRWTGALFRRLPLKNFSPLAGSLVVGIILLGFPQVGGYGHDIIDHILHGNEPLFIVAALIVLKIVATALTLESGNSGGIFAPALLVGACLGATIGYLIQLVFPGAGPIGAYATIGMAAVMAGTIHTPLTAMMLIFELTRDYNTILPLMTATVLSTLVAYATGHDSLYMAPLARKGLDFRLTRDLGSLGDVQAVQLMRTHFPCIHPDDTPAVIRHNLRRYPYKRAIYISENRTLLGYIPMDTFHLLDAFALDELNQAFPQTVHPKDTIYETLNKLRASAGILPVVGDEGSVLGIISNKIFIEKFLPLLKVSSAKRSGI